MTPAQLATPPPITPAPASGSGGRAALRQARSRRKALLARYLGYVGYFVGAGLISGAVVHHPLDPARYTRIAVYGVVVFLAATALNEFLLADRKPTPGRVVSIMGASLLLSFGIGMLSGGLQHFEDFPARAAVLIPIGIVLSFAAYVIKDEHSSWRRLFGPAGLAVLMAALLALGGLRYVASSIAGQPDGGGGHSHGPESTPLPGPSAPPTPAPTPAPARSATGAPGHGDGHAH
ncbi:hypothetical protein ACFTWH_30380 [Streptomyces sp. NPDC057011]|uniref:hypothetical protein n=1 Tax=unclassified Streptomyces TaxID=2593676 RepID=UPI00363609FF